MDDRQTEPLVRLAESIVELVGLLGGPPTSATVRVTIGGRCEHSVEIDPVLLSAVATRVREEVSRRVAPKAAEPEPATWPPKDGWAFRPGEAAFDGVAFAIGGRPWQILKRLASPAGEAVPVPDLKRAVWGDYNTSDDNVRTQVSTVRAKVREAFHLAAEYDPVPAADGAYRLDYC
jgi:hypothetical protein